MRGIAVQETLGFCVVARGERAPGVQATFEGDAEGGFFLGAGAGKDEIDDILAQSQRARMPDAQAQPPETGAAKRGFDVLQAIVSAIAAALFETNAAGRQIQIVMQRQRFFRENPVKPRQRADGLPGTIHEGGGLQEPAIPNAANIAKKPALRRKRDAQLARQRFQQPESGIVARGGIFRAGIAQTDDQAGREVHRDRRKQKPGTKAIHSIALANLALADPRPSPDYTCRESECAPCAFRGRRQKSSVHGVIDVIFKPVFSRKRPVLAEIAHGTLLDWACQRFPLFFFKEIEK